MVRRFISYLWKLSVVTSILLLMVGTWQPVSLAGPVPAPVLLVTNSAAPNKFGAYLGEILRAEGLNEFDVLDISNLTPTVLAQHDLTILAQTPLTSDQANTLTNYVSNGGRLLAMRPDAQIAGVFGLGTPAGTLTDGYLQINGTAAFNGATPGQGLTTATLQIHGSADQYNTLAGAATLAPLYSNATSATPYPAVVGFNYGTGQAVAFTYDLAQSVIYTRQGNPANANKIYGSIYVADSNGILGTWDIANPPVTRTISLFQLSNATNAPAWVDRDRIPIPQADEQQRLFARLVQQLVASTHPMPQLWYFPGNAKTMLILTGDAHGNPTSYYQNEINSITAHGGRMTFYLSIASNPTDSSVQTWRAQGYEFGIHPYSFKSDPYPPLNITSLAQGYDVYTNWFATTFSSPKSLTVRNHQVAWAGWTDAADIAAAHGIALDTSFYHWGAWLQKPDGTWPHGYITGSGQPMKFIRADGTILPIYQQLTELVDEQLLAVVTDGAGFEKLNGTQAIAVSQQLIDSSLAGDYAALMTQFHVDYYGLGDPQVWAEGTLDYARSKGVPIWNADQWLSFVQTRHDANYSSVTWNSTTGALSFNLTANATPGVTLTTMLPLTYSGLALQSVSVDGAPQSVSVQTIKGVNVAFVSVLAGNHSFSASYQPAAPLPTATNTPTNTPGPSPTPTNTPLPTSTPTNTPLPTATPMGAVVLLGSQTVGASQDNNPAGVSEAFQYTASASGTANTAYVYIDTSNTATRAVVGLYTNNSSNNPGTLLAQATITNPVRGTWNSVALPAASVVAATKYWIAVLGPTGAGMIYFRDVSSGSKAQTSSQSNLSTLPATWSAGTTYSNSPMSAYIVQNAPPTPTPLPPAATATPTPLPPTPTNTALPTAGPSPTPLPPTSTATPLPPTNTPLPTPTATPLSGSLTQATFNDFGATCTVLTNTHVSDVGGGAVVLAPTFADDFGGTALDATKWSSGNWSGGSYTPVISNSVMTVETSGGGWVRSLNTYTHGVVEAIAQFGNAASQHIGFASDGFAGNRYFIFSTYTGDGNLYARVNNNVAEQNVNLGAIPTGMHRYRIEWSALDANNDQVRFYVDGVQQATMNVTNVGATNFYLYLSNASSTVPLQVDAAQVTPPYLTSGSYTSCVLDAGLGNAWQTISWSATAPVNTGLAVQVRTSLDGVTWSAWSAVAASGGAITPLGRYAQYGLSLATTDSSTTPLVDSVTLTFSQAVLPTLTPTPVLVPTNTPTPLPPTSTPTPLPPTPTATPTVVSPTATPSSGSLTQATFNDFGAICAVLTNTHVSDIGGGAVVLAPTFADDFGGTALDATKWSSGNWSGGSYTPVISNSVMTVETSGGGWARSLNTYTHGVVEAIAQFGNTAWQHIGFGSDGFSGNRYFLFSTYIGDGNLYARVNNNVAEQRVNLGPIPTGMHRYRIQWSALDANNDQVLFYIDGVQQASMTVANVGATNFYLYLSNASSSVPLNVDAAQVTPTYQTSGTYTSCALDAGLGNAWQTASWNAGTPASTSLTVQVRTSSDGVTWNASSPVAASGNAISPIGRYVQYSLSLATTDNTTTPQVNSVTLGWQQQP